MFYDDAALKRLEERYPVGTRIRLISMSDPRPIPSGTCGVVEYIDDAGQIHMKWDNGRGLALVPDEDQFEKVEEPPLGVKLKQENPRVFDALYLVYKDYISEWLVCHDGPHYKGMKPSSFSEWLENDLSFFDLSNPIPFVAYPSLFVSYEDLGDTFETETERTISYSFSYINQQEEELILNGFLRLPFDGLPFVDDINIFEHLTDSFFELCAKPDISALSTLTMRAVNEVASNDSSMFFYEVDDFITDIQEGVISGKDFVNLLQDIKKYNLEDMLEVAVDRNLTEVQLNHLLNEYASLKKPFTEDNVITGYGDLAVTFDFSSVTKDLLKSSIERGVER